MKRITCSILGATISPIIFWLSGYDFNERGENAVGCFLISTIICIGIYYFPELND